MEEIKGTEKEGKEVAKFCKEVGNKDVRKGYEFRYEIEGRKERIEGYAYGKSKREVMFYALERLFEWYGKC